MKKDKQKSNKGHNKTSEKPVSAEKEPGSTLTPDKADIEEFKERKEESKKAGEEGAETKEDKQA